MRIFIAGATGVVGRSLIPLLLRAGHRLTCATRTDRGVQALDSMGVSAVRLDVHDAAATRAALAVARPEAVMHQLTDLSGTDLEANARLRIAGTRSLVDAARAAGVQRMVAQSIAFAYAPGAGPATESEPLDTGARGPRARTVEGVVALESAVRELPEALILRYGLLYGPGTWYWPGGMQVEKIRAGTFPASPGIASFVQVEDAAAAAALALAWPAGTLNIVDDEPAPGTQWVPFLAKRLGGPTPPTAAAQPWERGAANAKARAAGWAPRYSSWREGFMMMRP